MFYALAKSEIILLLRRVKRNKNSIIQEERVKGVAETMAFVRSLVVFAYLSGLLLCEGKLSYRRRQSIFNKHIIDV